MIERLAVYHVERPEPEQTALQHQDHSTAFAASDPHNGASFVTTTLTAAQLERLDAAFRLGADDATDAMAKWLSAPSLISIESVEQHPIDDTLEMLSESDDALCFCIVALTGSLTGHLVLSFDDESGLRLADLLLGQSSGTATEWGEVEQSAALESHNIIGCAYLNSLAKHLPGAENEPLELIPSPPEFRRDFAEALLESLFMEQAIASDSIFVARARFELKGEPLHWTLLFVPDAPSMETLHTVLSREDSV